MATVTQLEVREVTPGKGQLQEGTLFKEVYGREEGEGGRGREREKERGERGYQQCCLRQRFNVIVT